MQAFVKLYSNKENEILRFLDLFTSKKFCDENNNTKLNKDLNINLSTNNKIVNSNNQFNVNAKDLEWKKEYSNPVEMADIIGVFIENNKKFNINMWISIDKDVLINVTEENNDDIIRYLYERFPY